MLLLGDCLEQMKTLEANSVDAVVTDPPYGLSFMGKRWDYDVPSVDVWCEVFRVLKPGGHVLSFGGTRTYHRMVVNIEDAGFEIRDQVQWIYGSGFPKSHNVSKAIDKKLFDWRHVEWEGWGSALKPANEPICLARKPLEKGLTLAENVLKYGTGAINVDGCRIGFKNLDDQKKSKNNYKPNGYDLKNSLYEFGSNVISTKQNPQGRWPANVLFDEDAAEMLDAQSGIRAPGAFPKKANETQNVAMSGKNYAREREARINTNSGGASRFFLVVKRDKFDITSACGPEKIKGEDTFAGKKAANKKDSLSTDGFGSKQTDQYLLTTISITETETNSIITFPILSASTKTCIGHITIVSEKITNLFLAENVESVSLVSDTEALINLNDGHSVLIKGTVSIALEENCKSGETQTEKNTTPIIGNTANASRFAYIAKASKRERNAGLDGMPAKTVSSWHFKCAICNKTYAKEKAKSGCQCENPEPESWTGESKNHHPTVKPIKLMEYLITLITPPNGTVLDPFMGSGSTGVAAKRLGFNFIGIEMSPDYYEIAKKRIEHASQNKQLDLDGAVV